MTFTQTEFLILLSVLILFMTVARSNRIRKFLLLAASYYFYIYWDYRFLALLLVPTLLDYSIGRLLSAATTPVRRRIYVSISVVVNLCVLGFFKYYNFFVLTFQSVFSAFGIGLSTMDVILPLGVSFYTFKTLSYVIDVYRNRMEACSSLLDYALFVSFFPTIPSGPIVTARMFLPQLREYKPISWDNIALAFRYFAIGLFLKVFLADRIGLYVTQVTSGASVFDSSTIWLAMLSYSLQLYFDFAGYSSMSIGIAKALGYDLPANFDFPYLSQSPSDFWKRWHITLSEWIRDYVYIPLGGNRKGETRTYVNLLLSMALCGLWHGASMTFLAWGVWHGAALGIHRFGSSRGFFLLRKQRPVFRLCNWALTMLLVVFGWVLFRSDSFAEALFLIRKMVVPAPGFVWYQPFCLFAIGCTVILNIAHAAKIDRTHELPIEAWYSPGALIAMVALSFMFWPKVFAPFIYANF